jgi:phospholipid/cholesterol/gamma-HCH transport system substrate-binding protein
VNKQAGKPNLRSFIWPIVVIIIIAGYYFMKGSNMLPHGHDYFAYFLDVQGLQPSSPVKIKGVRVGKITDITIDTNKKVKITITTGKDITLPVGTVAKLAGGSITGEKIIDIEPGPGPGILPDYAVLATELDSSVLPISVRFTPIFETAKFLLSSTDSILQEANFIISSSLISRTAIKVIKLEEQTKGFARASASLNDHTDGIVTAIRKAEVKSQNLVNKQDKLNNTISNAERKSAALAGKNILQNINNVQVSLNNLNNKLRRMNTSSAINDKKAYNNAVSSLDTLNSNMQQVQTHPGSISIFGGSKKKKK